MKLINTFCCLLFFVTFLSAQTTKQRHAVSLPIFQFENGQSVYSSPDFFWLKGLRYQYQFHNKWGVFTQATLKTGRLVFGGIDSSRGGPVKEHTFKIGVERNWFPGKLKLITQLCFYQEHTVIAEGTYSGINPETMTFTYDLNWKGVEGTLGVQYRFDKNWSVVAVAGTQFGVGERKSTIQGEPFDSRAQIGYLISHWLESFSVRYSFGGKNNNRRSKEGCKFQD